MKSWANQRRYLVWLASDTAHGLTVALVGFGIPILALFVTDDPARAGIIGGVGIAVRAIASSVGGVIADRYSRVSLMVIGAVVGLLIASCFTVAAMTDALSFIALLIVEVLLALRNGVFGVASEAALKNVVPTGAMGRAQGANQARDAVLSLLGGPLGGALLAVGATLMGLALVLCQAAAAVTAVALRRRTQDHTNPSAAVSAATEPTGCDLPVGGRTSGKMITELAEGFRWLFLRSDLRGVLFVATLVNLGFSTAVTTVIYGIQQAGHSPAVVGWVSAGTGAALLVGALSSAVFVARCRAGILVISGLSVLTISVLLLPLVGSVPLTIAVLGVGLLPMPVVNAAMNGYFMVATPDHLIGRVTSAVGLLATGAAPLAPLIAGFGLTILGRNPTLVLSGAICLVALLLAVARPGLRSLPAEHGWSEHAVSVGRCRS